MIYKAFLAFQPFQLPASRLALPLTAFSLRALGFALALPLPCLALLTGFRQKAKSKKQKAEGRRQKTGRQRAEGKRKKDCESEKKI